MSADIGFKRRGYLFISDDGDHARMEANHRRQESLGARVDLLDRDALKLRFRFICRNGIQSCIWTQRFFS